MICLEIGHLDSGPKNGRQGDVPCWINSKHTYDDVMKWKYFPRYWPFVRGIHRSPVNSPHKGQWRGALVFSLIGAWINGWVNNREAGDLRRHHAHCDDTVMNVQCHKFGKIFTGLTYKLPFSFAVISDVYRFFGPNKTTFTRYCLTRWI